MPLLSHYSWYDHHTNLVWRVQFTQLFIVQFSAVFFHSGRTQWRRGLRRGSAAALFLGLLFRIPPGAWMFVSCACCVLLCRGPWVGLNTRTKETYRVWCVWLWPWSLDNEEALAQWGYCATGKKKFSLLSSQALMCSQNTLLEHPQLMFFPCVRD
jgi:hypothetical protein